MTLLISKNWLEFGPRSAWGMAFQSLTEIIDATVPAGERTFLVIASTARFEHLDAPT